MSQARLTHPIEGKDVAGLLNLLILKFVPGFLIIETKAAPNLTEYEHGGVTIRRKKHEQAYENSAEPWWPTGQSWDCTVTGIPGVERITLSAGTSSPGAAEIYNFYEIVADASLQQKMEIDWRAILLRHAIHDRRVGADTFMPQRWQDFFKTKRNLALTGAFDWLKEYRLALAEDTAPLLFKCENQNWLATSSENLLTIRGAFPADLKTTKETRQRNTTGTEPHGLELALRLLPTESRWSELFHEESDACFLDICWGEKIRQRAWQNGNWLMRQSIGASKWGGMRSAYWLQPFALAEAARFSLLAMFEIYGGGATMSFNPEENNTHNFYSVVGGIGPAEKSVFLAQLDSVLKKDGWQKE